MAEINTKTTEEIISQTAAAAVLSVEAVGSMSSGPIVKPPKCYEIYKGIVLTEGKKHSYTIDIYMRIKYGEKIPQTAFAVQESVKAALDEIGGIEISSININIQGVDFPETD